MEAVIREALASRRVERQLVAMPSMDLVAMAATTAMREQAVPAVVGREAREAAGAATTVTRGVLMSF